MVRVLTSHMIAADDFVAADAAVGTNLGMGFEVFISSCFFGCLSLSAPRCDVGACDVRTPDDVASGAGSSATFSTGHPAIALVAHLTVPTVWHSASLVLTAC